MRWFYYLHTNGDLIGKNPVVVDSDPQYFDSPFVKQVWEINSDNRADCYKLILEALALGMNLGKAKELSTKWGMDYKDTVEMLARIKPTDIMREGMNKFVINILGMDIDYFWNTIKEKGNHVS